MVKRLSIALIILLLFSFSCRKNENRVPYIPVDLYLNITLPSYNTLNVIGGWVYVSGGSKGLIVYRQTAETFMVYDRHCTYDVNATCTPASVDSTNLAISCDCDGSQYQLYDGAITNGPATMPLQQYQSTYDGLANTLHIYN
ncbi:Rieske 2Fe-2S domain-containing protein [Flavobacteriales bacterium]|nr:Rieske 2Fe-2S domain-containing protein [Flavobacteriales bacterium]